ncbi:hypothetical protein [Kitasatospora purpeofusca]
MANGKLAGSTTWGDPMNPRTPVVHTDVSSYHPSVTQPTQA